MGFAKVVGKLALIVALGYGASCITDDCYEYEYDGQLNHEKITFTNESNHRDLIVTRMDGRKVHYRSSSWHKPLKIHGVTIHKGTNVLDYDDFFDLGSSVDEIVVAEGQKQFDYYLKKIIEAKKQQENEKIKEGLEEITKGFSTN
ncbi:MAG: hypothetical protein AABX11_04715 [Nanoarchaeota archaeon]